jgi:hypothetical protein
MECFFAIPPLPVLQPHCDKIAITHMFVSATVFFCNRSTSAVKDVCNHLYFHQVATTSSKDQTSHIKLFYQFFQSQSHCDMICNQLHSGLQLYFSLQSQHISRCKHTAKDVAITSIFGLGCNPSSKDHPSFNNTVSWHEAFLFFLKLVFFYPCFFETVFLQNHCSKVAITLL